MHLRYPAYATIYNSIVNCKIYPCEFGGSAKGLTVTGTVKLSEDFPGTLQVEILNLHTNEKDLKDDSSQKAPQLNTQLNNVLAAIFDGIKVKALENPKIEVIELLANTSRSVYFYLQIR